MVLIVIFHTNVNYIHYYMCEGLSVNVYHWQHVHEFAYVHVRNNFMNVFLYAYMYDHCTPLHYATEEVS